MPSRKNILFILSDDQGAWALGCAGNREVMTPNLDALAQGGIRFQNFFCVSPVCSPARASILTGRIPSSHGVHDWIRAGNLDDPKGSYGSCDRPIRYLEGLPGYTDFLAQAGYTCGLSGKWHLGASAQPQKGFSHWNAYAFGGGEYFNYKMVQGGRVVAHANYVTHEITEGALAFLESERGKADPFYLSVHYTAPHSPWDEKNHPPRFLDLYRSCPFHSTPDEGVHPWQTASAPVGDTREKRSANLRGYYAAITAMDEDVGRILAALKAMGEYENTLIVFSGDNGMNMGHHGIWGKGNGTFPMNMYEESVKVPFLVKAPGGPKGRVEDGLFSHYDVFPTLLDWAGLGARVPAELPGRSFAPLFAGQACRGPGEVVVFDEYGPVRMIRDARFKYVHRFAHPPSPGGTVAGSPGDAPVDGPHELYDLVADPGERVNLVGRGPAAEAKAGEMRARLSAWFERYAEPARDGSRLPVGGAGQLDTVTAHLEGAAAFFAYPKRYKA